MTEAELVTEVMALADSFGLLYHHCGDSRHCSGPKGLPDLIIAGPGGVLFAELKSDTGVTSADQDMWAWVFHQVGRTVRLWRPADLKDGRIRQELELIVLSHAAAIASGRQVSPAAAAAWRMLLAVFAARS